MQIGVARGRVSQPKWRLICDQIFNVSVTTGLEDRLSRDDCEVSHAKARNDEEQEAVSLWHQLVWGDVHHNNILYILDAQ